MRVVTLRLVILVAAFAAWELIARAANPLLYVPPSAVLPALRRSLTLESYPDLPASLLLTLREIVVAYGLAIAAGLASGFALGLHRVVGRAYGPILAALYAVPAVVWYPSLMLFFGLGEASKIAFGFLLGFFPITLAVLWLELAVGLGLQARGVNFPGHFMVKVNLPQGQVVIDPFTGQSLSREDLSERLEPFKRRNGLVDDFDVPVGLYLQSAQPRDILARVLRNLKEIHNAQEDWTRLVAVLDRLVLLQPDAWSDIRDRGLAWAELGQPARAVPDLEAYLAHAEDPLDADAISERLRALRRELS